MKKFYTNGVKTIKLDIEAGDETPEGFHPGRTMKSNPWNKGLSAKTDERVRNNTQRCHETRKKKDNYKSWNEGLTKETNESLQRVSEKVSACRKGKPTWNKGIPATEERKQKQSEAMQGKPAWNKGLTKETNESIASTSEKLLRHECFVTDWQVAKEKENQTKHKNGSFGISKPEEMLYEQLKQQYGEEDVARQYRDPRYPFNCDFYIKSEDLFIELNYTWCHGPKPFENTEEDQILLNIWKEKAKTSEYYQQAIHTWTVSDVNKLSAFKQNKLNFIILYPDSNSSINN